MRPSEPVPTVWKMDAVPREGETEEMTAASNLLLVDAADGRLLIEPGHFPAGHLLFGCLEQGYTTLGVYGMGARVYDPSLMRSLPTRSNPNSAVFKWKQRTLGYYESDGFFRYSVSLFNNHGLPGHALIHWHLENPLSHWHSDPINNVFEFLWHLFGGFF